ncbi:DUF1073 domain-containing protein [Hoeflea sp. G2-23]|uniref:Anti-CBASS protein Acb1 n=1 Tax=Hoeflea algicola TaxID=2983763 RepID=A0ABT3ZGF1_9HYPH|nr:anti-CBASS Acb1 family protein [Hoeflea algicola]MCY0150895.1 DUF1073 domain-containing protein [Hoeflea algicola]
MQILDTLKSLVTGLGTSKDKTTDMAYALRYVTDAELNAMHRSDWLARKIVDIIPNDMTREWRDWQAENDQIELLEKIEADPLINVRAKVNAAMRRARLLRGAAIYMGMKDGTPENPLDMDRIRKGDLLYLHVLNRNEVTVGEINRDVTSEFYGEPISYTVNSKIGNTVTVHPSRMIRFIGADILDDTFNDDGWGDSILQIVYDAVQSATSVHQHVAALIPEAKTDVIYIPGLSKFLQNPTTTRQLTDRFTYANSIKSMFNMVLLEGDGKDAGEKWEQKTINFAQLPEITQQFLQIAAGAADIPVTRLLGQSPSGMNATGESDIRNYYDNISARQKTELAPNLHRLDEVVIRSALGNRPEEIHYTWSPLWGLSEKEKADVFKTKTDAARAIAGNGTNDPLMPIETLSEAFTNMLIEDGTMPGLEAAIEEFGKISDLPPAPEEEIDPIPPRQVAEDAAPRTLYVRRDVVNVDEIAAWAKSQGIADLVDDLHVTIVYSPTPIDWIKAGNDSEWGEPNGKDELVIAEAGRAQLNRWATWALC